MKFQVELISEEYVKPSSPTPHHLRHYQLSFLDQISPQVYNSMVYFFAPNSQFNATNVSHRLKTSLSQTLTRYYPLAGRIVNKSFIDCNDDGVPYSQARVNCRLNDVVHNPIPSEVSKLLPFQIDQVFDLALGVQLNIFDCGGVAVGACISHQVADALSYFQFIKNWAAIARGEPDYLIKTHFISTKLFPPKDIFSGNDFNSNVEKERIVSKRLGFCASSVEALREKYAEKMAPKSQKPPSRMEALSAFIWSRFVAATQLECGIQKLNIVAHTVNLRPRMEPPLPDYAFGNYYRAAVTCPSLDENGEFCDLVMQLREQVKKIDRDYVTKLQEGEDYLKSLREGLNRRLGKEEMVPFTFTGLCRFPVYDADFGWGKPIWVGPPAWKFKNVVVFTDAESGGGIDAYVSLKEEDMAKFENDKQLLDRACLYH